MTFSYDPFSLLRDKTWSAWDELYIYSASDERIGVRLPDWMTWRFTIRDEAGRVLREYESLGQYQSAAYLWVSDHVYAGGRLVGAQRQPEDAGRTHVHPDHLGTPRLITNETGEALSINDYAPFGNELTSGAQMLTRGYEREELRKFTGHERDFGTSSTTGDYVDYMHARYYSPSWGRFLSVDPVIDVEAALRNPQLWNRYSYVSNNPINRIDPTGKLGCKANGKQIDCHIVVVYDKDKSKGTIYLVGTFGSGKNKTEKILLQGKVVVGADGKTPTGKFTASYWEKDHVSQRYGRAADTPWSKSPLGLNAFGPYQLHIKELEKRGIWIHGTMGPGRFGSSEFNRLLSPYSQGCVRCSNPTIMKLYDLMPDPSGNRILFSTNPNDAPEDDD